MTCDSVKFPSLSHSLPVIYYFSLFSYLSTSIMVNKLDNKKTGSMGTVS